MKRSRFFDVKLIDNETNNKKIRFRASIIKKKQKKGRLGGDVNEELYFDSILLEQLEPEYKVLFEKNRKTLMESTEFQDSEYFEF